MTKKHSFIHLLFAISIIFLSVACSPKVVTNVQVQAPALPANTEVVVTENRNNLDNANFIGNIKIGDSGFTMDCSYSTIISWAKSKALNMGGNLIVITKHLSPDAWSSCHRIEAEVYNVNNDTKNLISTNLKGELDTTIDYAILHIFRSGSLGCMVKYSLNFDEYKFCKVSTNYMTTVKVYNLGEHIIWGQTEVRVEEKVNFEKGQTYYLECGVGMGVLVGRPELTIYTGDVGKYAYEKAKKKCKFYKLQNDEIR